MCCCAQPSWRFDGSGHHREHSQRSERWEEGGVAVVAGVVVAAAAADADAVVVVAGGGGGGGGESGGPDAGLPHDAAVVARRNRTTLCGEKSGKKPWRKIYIHEEGKYKLFND